MCCLAHSCSFCSFSFCIRDVPVSLSFDFSLFTGEGILTLSSCHFSSSCSHVPCQPWLVDASATSLPWQLGGGLFQEKTVIHRFFFNTLCSLSSVSSRCVCEHQMSNEPSFELFFSDMLPLLQSLVPLMCVLIISVPKTCLKLSFSWSNLLLQSDDDSLWACFMVRICIEVSVGCTQGCLALTCPHICILIVFKEQNVSFLIFPSNSLVCSLLFWIVVLQSRFSSWRFTQGLWSLRLMVPVLGCIALCRAGFGIQILFVGLLPETFHNVES